MRTLSALLARELGKPEEYVMVALDDRAPKVMFGGSLAPACFASLKNVGTLSASDAERLSAVLCDELARGLGVARNRVYLELVNVDGALWGWDGGTFG